MNRIEIIGHIGKDAEVKELNGNTVINFNVAVTEKWNDQNGQQQSKTYWYQCARWVKNATIAQYLTKGTQVYVSGKPEARSYQNQQGGIEQVVGITVQQITLLGGGQQQAKPQGQPMQQNNGQFNQPQGQPNQFQQGPQQNFNQPQQQGFSQQAQQGFEQQQQGNWNPNQQGDLPF